MLYEFDPAGLPVLEAAAYPEYLAGLREAGWDGDPQQVRLAYCAWLALWCGAMMPAFASLYGAENGPGITLFDCQPEEMIAGWAIMCDFALDRGEEARRLVQQLGQKPPQKGETERSRRPAVRA